MRTRLPLAAAAVAVLLLTACGGEDGNNDQDPATAPASEAPPTSQEKERTLDLGRTVHTAGSNHPLEGNGGGMLGITPSTVAYV
ncbi:hypothetical protein AB0H77_33105 [Streptomyces sp. NPDC050844]|uniref:hypothetical protein n=1 Tax=Streptomyces sp. NPDC050844 TaxID=3155790 RepID=UPI0033C72808